MIYIAAQTLEKKRVKIPDIVRQTGSPEAFTGKILGALTKHGILLSHTGPNGGFEIDPAKMHTIKLSEIVLAIDGSSSYEGCVLGLSECSQLHPCPVHDKMIKIRNQLRQTLETTTLYELATGQLSGKFTLIR